MCEKVIKSTHQANILSHQPLRHCCDYVKKKDSSFSALQPLCSEVFGALGCPAALAVFCVNGL